MVPSAEEIKRVQALSLLLEAYESKKEAGKNPSSAVLPRWRGAEGFKRFP